MIWRWLKTILLGGTQNTLDSQRHQPQSHTTTCEWHAVQQVGATVPEQYVHCSVVYVAGAEITTFLSFTKLVPKLRSGYSYSPTGCDVN